MKSDLEQFYAFWGRERKRIDKRLREVMKDVRGKPALLGEAMRYSALSEGKRLRAVLSVLGYSLSGRRPGRSV